jgi:CubicO group peptidase (beta-lactamase class C family)
VPPSIPRNGPNVPAPYAPVAEIVEDWVRRDQVPGTVIQVGTGEGELATIVAGRSEPDGNAPPLRRDTLFAVSSLTKPITAAAVACLVDRGLLALDEPASRFVPAFTGDGKERITIRQLLTHTSGLPNLLPNNRQLRMEHRPLADFIAAICRLPLHCEPGTAVNYQGVGFAVLGEVVRNVTGRELPGFLAEEFFAPLGMNDTCLGLDSSNRSRVARIRMAPPYQDSDWHWNSDYWLSFGAPWTGLTTTIDDYARFCRLMLLRGRWAQQQLLSPAAVHEMLANQLHAFPAIPEEQRRLRGWGLGWRHNWPGHPSCFGDGLGPRAAGHWGASGTMCWLDPDGDTYCVLFTNQAFVSARCPVARLSHAVLARRNS